MNTHNINPFQYISYYITEKRRARMRSIIDGQMIEVVDNDDIAVGFKEA
jgi:hypothetical protein